MLKATVFLVVLVAPHGCKLDSIDRAEATFIKMPSPDDCDAAALRLDEEPGQRAFCWSANQ